MMDICVMVTVVGHAVASAKPPPSRLAQGHAKGSTTPEWQHTPGSRGGGMDCNASLEGKAI